MPEIKRRQQSRELSRVHKRNLALAAKSSCPELPESKGGWIQIIKMIVKNNGQESLIQVLQDFGVGIPILN
jgi:hypothetical protein